MSGKLRRWNNVRRWGSEDKAAHERAEARKGEEENFKTEAPIVCGGRSFALLGLVHLLLSSPGAYAPGYIIPPLRGGLPEPKI